MTAGGDLSGCVRFSLLPADGVPLPRHDIVGVSMERRFCRGFVKAQLNNIETLPGKFFWKDGSCILKTSEDVTGQMKKGDLIGKGVAGERYYLVADVHSDRVELSEPYAGISKPKGFQAKKLIPLGAPRRIYLHCIICAGHRIWINYSNGAVLVTAKDREIYL